MTLLRKFWPDDLPLRKALPRYLIGGAAIIMLIGTEGATDPNI